MDNRRRALLASASSGGGIPNSEIWYTSTDGNVVTPSSSADFGANIVSNTYKNGKGIIKFDGPVTSIGYNAFGYCKRLTSITIPNSVTSIGRHAFGYCESLTSITISNSVTSIEYQAFISCKSLTEITIPNGVTSIGDYAFDYCSSLKNVFCKPTTPPAGGYDMFDDIHSSAKIYVPIGSDAAYKAKQYWSDYASMIVDAYTPTRYYDLTITADDVSGRETTTTIYWSCMSDGIDVIDGTAITGVVLTGTAISAEFAQNKSTTKTVKRTITFEYQGLTASTTITQGVWKTAKYTVVLNDQWQLSRSISNPNASAYDGVYESFSNKGVNNSQAVMYLDIEGYDTFKIYIRSYAESSYDYVMVSQPDQTIDNNTSYNNTSLVKAHTSGSQNRGTSISSYQLVEYTGLNSGKHRITIVYRKDSSAADGYDQGYLLIPKNQ